MALTTLREIVSLYDWGRVAAMPLPDPGLVGLGDQYHLLRLARVMGLGTDRWKVPHTHVSTYTSNYDRSALVYDHASGTWLPVRLPIVVGSLVAGKATLTGTTSTTSLGSVTIPAALLQVGAIIRVALSLTFTDPPTGTYSTDLLLGGVAIDGDALDGTTGARRRWEVEIVLEEDDSSSPVTAWYRNDTTAGAVGFASNTASGIDLSVDVTLELRATLSDGSDQLDVYGGHVEVIRP